MRLLLFFVHRSDKTFALATEDGLAKQQVRVCKKCFLHLASQRSERKGGAQQLEAKRLENKRRLKQEEVDKTAEADLLTAKSHCRGADMQLVRSARRECPRRTIERVGTPRPLVLPPCWLEVRVAPAVD
eukprot:SAG22_NODE_408_length_10942_cov_6.157429_3_plen_129_part_00